LLVILALGDVLAPVITSAILAFLMYGMTAQLMARNVPSWLALSLAFLVFVGTFFGILLIVMPLVWKQMAALFNELPAMLTQWQHSLALLPERYPDLITEQQIKELVATIRSELASIGQTILSFSISRIPNVLGILIYIVLVPILVFFFLKDREVILNWLSAFLPSKRPILAKVWEEMNEQVANYVRGKAIEILIVGGVSYLCFVILGLNYAALLGLLVGLSVLIPYIGAAVVTVPVLMIGYFQWGMAAEFYTLFIAYTVIQALDGNVLVPLLFSEAVNLHPVAIILAVLVFGGIWGLWGVFFAIPLATLIKAVINAWPTVTSVEKESAVV
jgi:putative permease